MPIGVVAALGLAAAAVAFATCRGDAGRPADVASPETSGPAGARPTRAGGGTSHGPGPRRPSARAAPVEELPPPPAPDADADAAADAAREEAARARRALVPGHVPELMTRLIAEKAAERPDPADVTPDAPPGTPAKGSLAAARSWLSRDLPKLLWDTTAADLALTADELDAAWKDRRDARVRAASYGSGSFVVVKRPDAAAARRADPGAPAEPSAPPATEEQWWTGAPTAERTRWLVAFFVESSGMFEVVRVSEGTPCDGCGGTGRVLAVRTDGTVTVEWCTACNGAGVVRKVEYR